MTNHNNYSNIIECIPNFSEGRDVKIIEAIAQSIEDTKGVKLLHIDRGEAANRTVFTFVGEAKAVVEAAFQAAKVATQRIDMRSQKGTHPRIGAMDVCPLVPIADISIDELKKYALQLGERLTKELEVPIYLYEHSAIIPARKNLATIRKGEYEGLEQKMSMEAWKPDFGAKFNPQTGATVLGVRDFLIAYNVNLNTRSAKIAHKIAQEIRESGKVVKIENDEKVRIPGQCKALKAIGWFIEEYDKAQVSMNLTNFKITGIHQAYETCKKIAQKYGINVTGSELIGLIPLTAILEAGKYYLKKENKIQTPSEAQIIDIAIQQLGLGELSPFLYKERIIEYLI